MRHVGLLHLLLLRRSRHPPLRVGTGRAQEAQDPSLATGPGLPGLGRYRLVVVGDASAEAAVDAGARRDALAKHVAESRSEHLLGIARGVVGGCRKEIR